MIQFLNTLLRSFETKISKKRKVTDLEKYILSHKPDSLEQVEWLQRQYINGKTKNDHLYY